MIGLSHNSQDYTGKSTQMSPTHSLEAASLINIVYREFQKITDPRVSSGNRYIKLTDHLMSGLAIFGLKFPSLLSYDTERRHTHIQNNLKTLYHVEIPPSDTYLRERIDEIETNSLRQPFRKIFSHMQRSKLLEEFTFLDGHYLLSIDGTGKFSSSNICCKHCCKKTSNTGLETYYHQMLGACIVHPDKKNVIPICPEVIINQDGHVKNDCERNATKRFMEHFRREHPHLKVIVVEDGLASNAPHIEMLEMYKCKYILGAKPSDHKFLFSTLAQSKDSEYLEIRDDQGILHQFYFLNNTSLNKSHPDLKVNVLEYRQTTSKGKELTMSWVTNIKITKENAYQIMIGGRARWKIENETFNTLKNLGYNFEHNYGHGKQYLASNFCLLMMLAFLIDQILEMACSYFQNAKKQAGTYRSLWEKMRTFFEYIKIESWELFFLLIAKKRRLDSS